MTSPAHRAAMRQVVAEERALRVRLCLAAIHPDITVEKTDGMGWSTVWRGTIAVNSHGGQSVFKRKKDAVSFAKFITRYFGERLDVLGNVEAHGAAAYISTDDRSALLAELAALHSTP